MIPLILIVMLIWMVIGILISLRFNLGVDLDNDKIIRSWKYALVGIVLCGPLIFIITMWIGLFGWVYDRVFNRFVFIDKLKKWMDD